MSMQSWQSLRARVASLSRDRSPDDPELIEARRALKATRLYDHVKSVVDSAPPLTTDQADRIAALLRPVSGGGQ